MAIMGATVDFAAAAPPPPIPVKPGWREAPFRGRGDGYRASMQLYGFLLLSVRVTGRLYCTRSDGERFTKHFRLRLQKDYLGVGRAGRFSYTDRPVKRGWTTYGVDQALTGTVGPGNVLPGYFTGHYEYAVWRPEFTCQTGSFRGPAEAPFRVQRVATQWPRPSDRGAIERSK
jgi:hypothetical protein